MLCRYLFGCFCLVVSLVLHHDLSAKTIIVGIAGGTGSGKTTLASAIGEVFPDTAVLIEQDNYYRDLSHLSLDQRVVHNYDHPKSIDFELLQKHLIELREGNPIQKPIYNFKTHTREKFSITVEPNRIILVDGILLFAVPEVRKLFDLKVYVDTDSDIRLLRRLERDIQERGRTIDNVKHQYLTTVKPMHSEFVEPSKYHADIIVPGGSNTSVAMDLIISKLKSHVLEN